MKPSAEVKHPKPAAHSAHQRIYETDVWRDHMQLYSSLSIHVGLMEARVFHTVPFLYRVPLCITAIPLQLMNRKLPRLHCGELVKALDWDRQFPHIKLIDFCEENTNWFTTHNAFITLKSTAPCHSQSQNTTASQKLPTAAEARDALINALSQHPGQEMPNWELFHAVDWDQQFGHLGKIAIFVEHNPYFFEMRNSSIALKRRSGAASGALHHEVPDLCAHVQMARELAPP